MLELIPILARKKHAISGSDIPNIQEIWTFIENTAEDVLKKNAGAESHSVVLDIRGIALKLELKFKDGKLDDVIPSINDEIKFDANCVSKPETTSVFPVFFNRMRILSERIAAMIAKQQGSHRAQNPSESRVPKINLTTIKKLNRKDTD